MISGRLSCLALLCCSACATAPVAPAPVAVVAPALTPPPPQVEGPGSGKLLTEGAEAFASRCDQDLARARAGVAQLSSLDAAKEQAKVLEVYDAIQSSLINAGARSSVAQSASPDAAVRTAAEGCEQRVSKLGTEIDLDRKVYDAINAVKLEGQTPATVTWIKHTLRDMRRSGVDRDEPTRAKVRQLNDELTKLGQDFSRNIREDVRSVELTPKELAGLPDDFVKAHPKGANGKVKINTDYPDYVPFLTYGRSAKAREALWKIYRMRGYPKNNEVLKALLAKRYEFATLLGYKSWAAYNTETKMIGTAEKAAEFIDTVNKAAEGAAKKEFALLLAEKRRDEPKAKQLDPWDQDYYLDRYKAREFGFDSQLARPYFDYPRVLAGVLDITSTMFGIRYQKVTDAKVWDPDVETYDVVDDSGLLGRIHLDMHPRADKYKHAAMFALREGQAGKRLPEGVLLCNFPKPGAQPALMQPQEVETFFHEFGHLLHHIFAGKQTWAGQAGVNTEMDFVEAPSMLLQEWAQNPVVLARFAKHYQTGEPIPADLINRMVAAKEFGKGLFTRRQMYLSDVSLEFHNRAPGFDPTALAKELQPRFEPFRKEVVDGTYFPLSFGHIEGYSAAYYTYIWSSVIARDLLTVFTAEGVLNPAPAQRYRNAILDAGGSKEAALLVKDFLGRDYSFKAYETWLNTEAKLGPSTSSSGKP